MASRLLAAVAILLSVLASSCASVSTSRGGEYEPRQYDHAASDLVEMAESACLMYFKRKSERTQGPQGSYLLFVNNNNFWAGDTDVNITIRTLAPNKSEVDFASQGAGLNVPLWNRSVNDLLGFFKALDQVVREKALDDLIRERAAAETRSNTSPTGN